MVVVRLGAARKGLRAARPRRTSTTRRAGSGSRRDKGSGGLSQPKENRNTVIDLNAVSSFTLGERVFHQKFGYGAVIGIEGDKLEIEFEKAGTKKVVAKFLSTSDDVPF